MVSSSPRKSSITCFLDSSSAQPGNLKSVPPALWWLLRNCLAWIEFWFQIKLWLEMHLSAESDLFGMTVKSHKDGESVFVPATQGFMPQIRHQWDFWCNSKCHCLWKYSIKYVLCFSLNSFTQPSLHTVHYRSGSVQPANFNGLRKWLLFALHLHTENYFFPICIWFEIENLIISVLPCLLPISLDSSEDFSQVNKTVFVFCVWWFCQIKLKLYN